MNYLEEKIQKTLEEIQKLGASHKMQDKLNNATDAEKKKVDEIRRNVAIFTKNKDFDGLKRYLGHVKSQEQ